MSSTAIRFVAQIRRNLESWRAGEIDYATFTEFQRDTWAGIQAAGLHVAAEVLRALSGATRVTDVLILEDAHQSTVQLRVPTLAVVPPTPRYRGLVARTAGGSPVLKVQAADPRSQQAGHRQVAAMIYEIAADMEHRSYQLEVHWTIAADPDNGQVTLELAGEHESELADELIAKVMTERQLI